jgi:hypothetical protein
MEIKKLSVFPGCCLSQQENVVVESAGDAAPLENPGASEATGWVQCCTVFPGEAGSCGGATSMETDEHEWCVA